jgi:hypothetical protein
LENKSKCKINGKLIEQNKNDKNIFLYALALKIQHTNSAEYWKFVAYTYK